MLKILLTAIIPADSKKCTGLKQIGRILYCSIALYLCSSAAFGEGSKELNSNGGDRAFLYSSTASPINPFPTQGLVRVYVKQGESIYVGSSAQGVGGGITYLRSPNGTLYDTGGLAATVGLIKTRAQELTGPDPTPGGYNPAIFSASAASDEGVWEVFFVGPTNGTTNPTTTASNTNGNIYQPTNSGYVAAFDVSVRNAAGTAFIPGRAYMNVFGACSGVSTAEFKGIFHVLTKDGATYKVDANGLQGQTFAFFANNKGYKDGSGNATYSSSTTTAVTNLQDPRNEDTATDFTHKLFFNPCATDLPATAPCRSSDGKYNTAGTLGTTWLNTSVNLPVVSNFTFTGVEGTANAAGTSPLGSNIGFESNQNTGYVLNLDLNQDGIFNNHAKDRSLTGTAVVGSNLKYWDGLDGQGNKVLGNIILTPSQVEVVLKAGEVHFPLIDVENNPQGIIITRTNGGSTSDLIYWNDTNISGTNQSVNGISSTTNGHIWNSNFGNNRGIDTWTYILSTPLNPSVSIHIQEADLQIASVTKSGTVFCFGEPGSFTVSVKNNGPHDVSGAKFLFVFPAEFTSISVSAPGFTGTASLTSSNLTSNSYEALLNMSNGAVVTFTITGTITTRPSGNTFDITASILRPPDVTDPDATNPDSAVPVSAALECSTGCNNIIIESTQIPLIITPVITLSN